MKIGIVSLGGESSRLVAKECQKYFDEVVELDLRMFDVHIIDNERKVTYGGKDLGNFDCLFIRGSHKYALLQRAITNQFSRKAYMPISPRAFTIGHDKFLTTLLLQEEGITVPKTYYAANFKTVKRLLKEVVSYPIILKAQSGTHGKGVLIAENVKTALGILDILDSFKQPFIIQEFVKTDATSDIRAVVCGKKVIASYLRVANEEEFRSNVHAGGTRREHSLTKEQERLAVKSAKALGCDICGVDILNSKIPSVIEINLSPSLHSIHEVTGVNTVWEVAKELYNQTVKFQAFRDLRLRKKLEKKAKKSNGNGKDKKVGVSKNINEDEIIEKVVESLTEDVVLKENVERLDDFGREDVSDVFERRQNKVDELMILKDKNLLVREEGDKGARIVFN